MNILQCYYFSRNDPFYVPSHAKYEFMMIRIHLEKAYDHLKCSFIRSTLLEMRLPQLLIEVAVIWIASLHIYDSVMEWRAITIFLAWTGDYTRRQALSVPFCYLHCSCVTSNWGAFRRLCDIIHKIWLLTSTQKLWFFFWRRGLQFVIITRGSCLGKFRFSSFNIAFGRLMCVLIGWLIGQLDSPPQLCPLIILLFSLIGFW